MLFGGGEGAAGRGIKWLVWDKLCASREGGGLECKKLRNFNVVMLAKQGWRIINNDVNPLVTKLMQARYFPRTGFFNVDMGANPSYVWRSIMEAQDQKMYWQWK